MAARGHRRLPRSVHHSTAYRLQRRTRLPSAILGYLREDPRCAFEVAPNDPPYCGVRGQAEATLSMDGAGALLERLIARYLGDTNPSLSKWLLSRAEEEWLIRLDPTWVSAWDYRGRMSGTPGRD